MFHSILHDVFGVDFVHPQPRIKSSIDCGLLSQNQLPRFPSSSQHLPQVEVFVDDAHRLMWAKPLIYTYQMHFLLVCYNNCGLVV